MDYTRIFLCVLIMAVVTYLPRMAPLVFFRKKIKSRFVISFLHYVPYAVLAAMTFPEILYSTGNLISGIVGLAAGLALALFNRSLIIVALGTSVAVFFTDMVLQLIMTI